MPTPKPFIIGDDLVALAQKVIRDHGGLTPPPADLLSSVADLIEAGADARHQAVVIGPVLARYGLTPGQFNDMASVASYAEARAAEKPTELMGDQRGWLLSWEARRLAVCLWLRGLHPDVIASALELDEDRVRATIHGRSGAHRLERTFVLGALEGVTTRDIARFHGVHWRTVERALHRAGLKSALVNERTKQKANRQQIIALRNAGKGYPEIRDITGASTNQIRNALRWAKAKGRLEYEPGKGAGHEPGKGSVAA